MTNAPFQYLMQVSICLMACYAIWYLVFKPLTFFALNRFFLLFSITACLIVPALHITVYKQLPAIQVHPQPVTVKNTTIENETAHPIAQHTASVNWLDIGGAVYALICAGLLCRLFFNIAKIILKAKRLGVKSGSDYIITDPQGSNASFFNIIFLRQQSDDPSEIEQILAHERAHVKLYHSADKLYLQLIKAFLWFNPIIYLMYKDLNEVHEFQVDNSLKRLFNPQAYAMLLLKLSASPKFAIVNQFSAVALKSRIKMLMGAKSMGAKRWLYLLILPLLSVMLFSFSVEKVYRYGKAKKQIVLVLDAGHGGKENGAVGIGGHKEKDITLALVQQIKSAAEARGIKVILTRKDDSYLDFNDRLVYNGDACISIHVNMTSQGLKDKASHGMLIMVSKNALLPRSEKLALDVRASLQQLDGANKDHRVDLEEGQQNLHILRDNKAPAILIEMGYISNQNDVNYLLSTEGQRAVADKIADAVVAFGNAK